MKNLLVFFVLGSFLFLNSCEKEDEIQEYKGDGDVLKTPTKGMPKYKLNLYTSLSLIDARYVNTKNTTIADKLVENAKCFTRHADSYPGSRIIPADRRNLYVTLQF